jgi:L-rhamnose isomerase
LTRRLALLEELKTLPLGAVWDHYCLSGGVPPALGWIDSVREYEKQVLDSRRRRP